MATSITLKKATSTVGADNQHQPSLIDIKWNGVMETQLTNMHVEANNLQNLLTVFFR
jgi:hypothetical protein